MNVAVLAGRITKDIVVRKTPSGKSVCKFVLAVPRKAKDESDFISCVAWEKTADVMGQYLQKGSKIIAKGRIETDVYEKDGKKVYTTEFIVESFESGEKKKEGKAEDAGFVDVKEEEELPFVF